MTIYANILRGLSRSAYQCIALIFSWLSGLLIGCCLCKLYSFSLMRSALLQPVSIVGLFVCIFLPLILSYFSFAANKPIFITIVCFLKAVAFGFSCALVSQTFDAASWLIQILFLFSDSCFLLVLFVLWLRRFLIADAHGVGDILVCAVFGILIASADYFVVSPILEGLF